MTSDQQQSVAVCMVNDRGTDLLEGNPFTAFEIYIEAVLLALDILEASENARRT